MTQSEWSQALGVSQSRVSMWENGRYDPPQEIVDRMDGVVPLADPVLVRLDELTAAVLQMAKDQLKMAEDVAALRKLGDAMPPRRRRA